MPTTTKHCYTAQSDRGTARTDAALRQTAAGHTESITNRWIATIPTKRHAKRIRAMRYAKPSAVTVFARMPMTHATQQPKERQKRAAPAQA